MLAFALLLTTAPHVTRVDEDHLTIRVVLTTTARSMSEAATTVALPDHFVVTGMTLAHGSEVLAGVIRDRIEARRDYDEIVEVIKDPALVDWIDRRHVRMRVFPLTRYDKAVVTLELEREQPIQACVKRGASLLATPWNQERARVDPVAEYWPRHVELAFAPPEPDE